MISAYYICRIYSDVLQSFYLGSKQYEPGQTAPKVSGSILLAMQMREQMTTGVKGSNMIKHVQYYLY